jgi:general secretion pathway protein E
MTDVNMGYAARERLGEILVRTGMITPYQLQQALEIARMDNSLIGRVLVEKGWLSTHDLATALSIQMAMTLIDLKKHKVRTEAMKLVPEQLVRKYNVLPLDIIGGSLTLVMENVMDVQAIDDIAAVSKLRIEPVIGFADDIRSAIDRNYTIRGQTMNETAASLAYGKETLEAGEDTLEDTEAPALRNLDMIIQQAVRSRASDIHIEPKEDRLQIRFRIDGILQDVMSFPMDNHAALISRLKVMGGMNIAEKRRPQDGRFSATVDDKDIDVRVACANTVHGEMSVMRLLIKSALMLDLTALGFLSDTLERYERMLKLPFGIILLGGPTGSGKTTTLYASISRLNRVQLNIMTIEDPVEYELEGINQVQVNIKAGVDFSSSLRAFMRLDPDVILVGEIRDVETARIAIQAAITGHLVFSSVHANDAVSIMSRLIDLGVEPFFLCSALAGTVSQRIVRRICPHCREPYKPTVEERLAYQKEMDEPPPELLKGAGCNVCSGTGYLGRVGIFELLLPTEEVKRLLLDGASADRIREQAINDGMVPLMNDGMIKVKRGMTTISEVIRYVFY